MTMIPIDRTFIIAELSANHNNDFNLAVKTIESIAESGADAVKIQTYKPESLTIDVCNDYFKPNISGTWKGYTPWQLYREACMPYEWQPKLKEIAESLGLICFSSPFDFEAVDFLETMNCPIYKVASPEINDLPLIKYMAEKLKPIIISTGMASISDIAKAIETCHSVGNYDVSLLKCTTEYPAPYDMANLRTIPNMKDTFGVRVGLSDHTMGVVVPIAAVTLGATIVEKHYTLDRNLGGPDSSFSMEPDEFTSMVRDIRIVEVALGRISYELSPKANELRRFLFYTDDLKKGEYITSKNVRSVRGRGKLESSCFSELAEKKVNKDIAKGTPVSWSDIVN